MERRTFLGLVNMYTFVTYTLGRYVSNDVAIMSIRKFDLNIVLAFVLPIYNYKCEQTNYKNMFLLKAVFF